MESRVRVRIAQADLSRRKAHGDSVHLRHDLVRALLVRTAENPCKLPYRLVDGAHRLCKLKRELLDTTGTARRASPPRSTSLQRRTRCTC